MRYFKYISIAILGCVLCLVACSKEQAVETTNIFEKDYDPELALDLGNETSASFQGIVVDEDLVPMSNVNVSLGDNQTLTDTDGKFSFQNKTVNEKFALITAESKDHFKGYRNLTPATDKTNEVKIMLRKRVVVDQFNSDIGGTVYVEERDHKVIFQSGFVNEFNQPYHGEVQVAAIYIDPLGDNIELEMPGSLRAVNEYNGPVNLISYGMLNVELFGDQNQRLQLAEGSTAEIYVKSPSIERRRILPQIPLWYFSDQKGYWVEFGMSTYQDGYYVGTVSHFTPINVDEPCDLGDPDCDDLE